MKPRLLLFVLLTLLLPALCLAATKKKPAVVDDRGLKAVSKVEGDSRQRVALVIGNSTYVSSPLKNPANDARVMAASLRRLGFEVVEKTNLSYGAMAPRPQAPRPVRHDGQCLGMVQRLVWRELLRQQPERQPPGAIIG